MAMFGFAGTGMAWAAGPAPGGAITLAPHRAIYEFTLENSKAGGSVSEMSGRMVYELTGSVCEGFTQNTRFVTRVVGQEGAPTIGDMRSSSWEDGLGKRYRFSTTQHRDQKLAETTRGDATRAGELDDIKVDLTDPKPQVLAFGGKIYFPNQHIIALIAEAKAGQRLFSADLFDGSEKADKIFATTTIIGKQLPPGANKQLPQIKNAEALDGLISWPVSISYFERGSVRQDGTPTYELSFRLYENGVSRRLYIDYGEYAIRGVLREIELYEPTPCDPAKR